MKKTFRLCASMLIAFLMCFVASSCGDDDEEETKKTPTPAKVDFVTESLGLYKAMITEYVASGYDVEQRGEVHIASAEVKKENGVVVISVAVSGNRNIDFRLRGLGSLDNGYVFNYDDITSPTMYFTSSDLPASLLNKVVSSYGSNYATTDVVGLYVSKEKTISFASHVESFEAGESYIFFELSR